MESILAIRVQNQLPAPMIVLISRQSLSALKTNIKSFSTGTHDVT